MAERWFGRQGDFCMAYFQNSFFFFLFVFLLRKTKSYVSGKAAQILKRLMIDELGDVHLWTTNKTFKWRCLTKFLPFEGEHFRIVFPQFFVLCFLEIGRLGCHPLLATKLQRWAVQLTRLQTHFCVPNNPLYHLHNFSHNSVYQIYSTLLC